jgi:hypothetical protein
VTNIICFLCCSIAWCSDTHVTNMILFLQQKPSYTTTKEQNDINHMGIITPCYTTIKEQNHISHMGIRPPCYTTTNEILNFRCSIAWCSDTHVTNMICCFILV